MKLVEPAAELRGDLAVPGVKGICQRAVLLGAIAEGVSEIRGFGHAADTDAAVDAVRQLGVEVTEPDDGTLRVHGVGLRGLAAPAEPIDCRNAGTLLRLISGILAGQKGRFVLVGDESLTMRPHERIAVPLREMGAHVETTDGHAPVTIEGGGLRAIEYELPVASAQVKSCVLFAGLLASDGPTVVVEPVVTRDHTERMLRSLGVRVSKQGPRISVSPVDKLPPLSIDVSGDFSSAAPFVVAATLLPGSELRIHGVNLNPTRTGFLDVLERMGARISIYNRRTAAGEPVGDLEIEAAELVATNVRPAEVPNLVDELPLFALAAACARGESTVRGAEELRAKETDRIATTTEALRALGAHITATNDGFRIRGVPARPRGGSMHARGDHRIAMLGAVAGLLSQDGVKIEGADAVSVSFPEFFELLEAVARR